MTLAMVILFWPIPTGSVGSDGVNQGQGVRSYSNQTSRAGQLVGDGWVGWLSGDIRHPDGLPGDSSTAIIEEEEDDSDDSNDFGIDVYSAGHAASSLFRQLIGSQQPSLPTGPSARFRHLRC
jgi:hypothetical protein